MLYSGSKTENIPSKSSIAIIALCTPLSNSLTSNRGKNKSIKFLLNFPFPIKGNHLSQVIKIKFTSLTLHLPSLVFGDDPSIAIFSASTGLPLIIHKFTITARPPLFEQFKPSKFQLIQYLKLNQKSKISYSLALCDSKHWNPKIVCQREHCLSKLSTCIWTCMSTKPNNFHVYETSKKNST